MARHDWEILKKEREKKQLELFKNCFVELKDLSINIIDKDPPDGFLIKDKRKVAIELTELYWNKDSDGVDKRAQESTANQIMYIAQQKYLTLGLPPLQVNVSFVDDYGPIKNKNSRNLSSSDKERLSNYIVEKVRTYYPKLTTNTIVLDEYDINWKRILDEKINSISISRFPELTENCWVENGGGVVPGISAEKIIERINSKNEKVKKYCLEYDEAWLVMLESWTMLAGYFNFRHAEDVLTREYEFDFDRAFILRSGEKQVIELKKVIRINDVQ